MIDIADQYWKLQKRNNIADEYWKLEKERNNIADQYWILEKRGTILLISTEK